MSKKILKRSFALGALMAFVITGNVWAKEYGVDDSVVGTQETPVNITSTAVYGGVFSSSSSAGESIKKINDSENSINNARFENINITATKNDAQGGVIYNNGSGHKLTITKCTFENISLKRNDTGSKVSGGVIANVGGTLNMEEVTFSNNSISYTGSKTGGSAIFMSGGKGEWTKCTFSNNKISPAVWVNGGNVTLVNNQFLYNTKGGIQILAGNVTIAGKENHYTGNSSKGGIYVSSTGIVNFDGDSKVMMSGNDVDIYTKGDSSEVNIGLNAVVTSKSGIMSTDGEFNIYGGTLEVGATSTIANLGGSNGTIKYLKDVDVTVTTNTATNLTFEADGIVNDAVNGDIEKLIGEKFAGNNNGAKVRMLAGDIVGEVTGELEGEEVTNDDGTTKFIYRMKSSNEAPHEGNAAISHNANIALMAWRAETNDMNKRLGELRNANGDLGVWVRMVSGEDEFKSVNHEYTQYQLGYDEKLSVNPSWTVGVALTYTDGESTFTNGSGENTHKGLSVYGTRLNDDGSFIDLIAKYSRLEHDITSEGDKGDYGTNGYSVSAEYGKRFKQGKGLWIEPQVELTYGKVKSAEYLLGQKTVSQDAMESLVGRIGFSLGKDIKQGNVYARASYLYDFEGETNMAFTNGASRSFKYDLGGGWWEVGIGANINLSKATYIYADVEKTFGGEVDTNWQWNLGVRYSF